MKRHKTPAYFSLHESTSDMLVSNISAWKPLWAQQDKTSGKSTPVASGGGKRKKTASRSRPVTSLTRNNNVMNNNINNNLNRTNTSMYTGIMTAQYVNSTIYCSIFESKTLSPTVGICMIDPHTSTLRIAEILDSPTFVRTIHKLNVQTDVGTLEILLPTSLHRKKTNFFKILEANLPDNASINFIPEVAFKTNETSVDLLSKTIRESERDSFKVELRNKKFGLAAACASIAYLQSLPNHAFIHQNFIVKYESSEDSMFISTPAIRNLELLTSNASGINDQNLSLFKYLNATQTKMGERLLKNNITQPLTNKNSLLLRYEAVKDLIENDDIRNEIRNEMKQLVDMDNLFSYLCKKPRTDLETVNQQKINFVLLLKRVLIVTNNVREALEPLQSELIQEIHKTFKNENIDASLDLINDYINEDCMWVNKPVELRNQKCYAVKVGHNGLLDASRQLYKSLIDEILKHIEELSEKYNMPMESRYDNNRGFFIIIKDCNISWIEEAEEDCPFINYLQKGNNIEVTTMNIVKLNLRVESVLNEIFLMTEDTVDELIDKCRKFVSSYFLISEAFSLLDLISTFAVVSTRSIYDHYTCPEIENNNVAIKESRHPLLEHIYACDKTIDKTVIPNDLTVVSSTSRIQIITGPNMSGKSIYIKQVALSIILAQIGMFIPAEYASLKIFKSLFSRISNDVTEPNMSTFSMEMLEMSFVLQNADENSLIIIDELGRGTSYKDGISICISMLDKLRTLNCVCFFVTHFVGIPKIFKNKPGILELYIGVTDDENEHFKLQPGMNWVSGYGIKMVESMNLFPKDVIKEAKLLSDRLRVSKEYTTEGTKDAKIVTQKKLILNTYEMLRHILHNVSDDQLFATLSALENEFVEKYDPLIEEEINMEEGNGIPEPTAQPSENIGYKNSSLIDFDYLH